MEESIGKKEEGQSGEQIRLKPFQRRVFNMPVDILKSHWTLIKLKKSKFPVATRELIIKRVSYLVGKNRIKMEHLNQIKNDLEQQFIQQGTNV